MHVLKPWEKKKKKVNMQKLMTPTTYIKQQALNYPQVNMYSPPHNI